MTSYICAISGEQSNSKHYILKTTEGEELICAEALFHNEADRLMGRMLVDLVRRVEKLEAGPGDEDQAAAAAAGKKTPRPRKAVD